VDYRGKERGHAAAKTICFQGREIGAGEISRIRAIVAKHAPKGGTQGATRRKLAALVCREWEWRRANGELLLCACQDLLGRLSARGDLELPPSLRSTSRPRDEEEVVDVHRVNGCEQASARRERRPDRSPFRDHRSAQSAGDPSSDRERARAFGDGGPGGYAELRGYGGVGAGLPKDLFKRLRCWCHRAPSEPTFRRVLQSVHASEIDAKVGGWVAGQTDFKAIALDGKTLRGSSDGDRPPCHLLAVITHESGVVVAQSDGNVAEHGDQHPSVGRGSLHRQGHPVCAGHAEDCRRLVGLA
jgi:hypothetical protein